MDTTDNLFPAEVPPAELMAGALAPRPDGTFRDLSREAGQRPIVDYLEPETDGARGARFAAWARTHACRATLTRGSALFIPVFWSHAVHGFASPPARNSSAGITPPRVTSVNYWYRRVLELEDASAAYRRKQESRSRKRGGGFSNE